MQARVEREGDVVVVHLSGRMDVETAEPFSLACKSYLSGKKTVFDFRNVSFVGSSGILPFLETMQEFAVSNTAGVKFSGVGVEFRRVFAATPLGSVEIFDIPAHAVLAFQNPAAAPAPVILSVLLAPVAKATEAAPLAAAVAVETPADYLSFKRESSDDGVGLLDEEAL